LLHRAVEGPFTDDRISVLPPSCCCWRGVSWRVVSAGRAAAGATPGRRPPLAACRGAAVLRRRWPPSPCRGAARCSRLRVACTDGGSRTAVGGRRPESDAHALWRGRPPGAAHGLCAGFRQCGSFVEVCDVDCVLSLGRGLVLVRGGGMPSGRWRPALGGRPRRRPPRRRASPSPFFLADCGRLSVGWVSCWT
jgi:hypothetical protein